MKVQLTGEIERFVKEQVSSGEFESEEDVVRAGLRLLDEYQRRLTELRDEVRVGIGELDRGEGVPLDIEAIKRQVRASLEKRK